MTPVTLPQARIPLGWVRFPTDWQPGSTARVPVEIDIEWMRALLTLVARSGGTVGIDYALLVEESNLAPVLQPAGAGQAQDDPAPAYEPLQLQETPDARLQALEAQVQRLMSQINDLQQGYQV